MPSTLPRPNRLLRLEIGDAHTTLSLASPEGDPTAGGRTSIDIGQRNLRPGPFPTEPPRALDLELTIERVEDRLMPLVRHLPPGLLLQAHAPGVDLRAAIESAQGRPLGPTLTVAEVEAAFSHLSALASGRPPRPNEPLSRGREAAALLILREWMHHAGFATVSFERPQASAAHTAPG